MFRRAERTIVHKDGSQGAWNLCQKNKETGSVRSRTRLKGPEAKEW